MGWGAGLLVLLHPTVKEVNKVINNKDSVFTFVSDNFHRNYHIRWLKPIGFNNAYALMMRRKQAEELHINSITELKNYLEQK